MTAKRPMGVRLVALAFAAVLVASAVVSSHRIAVPVVLGYLSAPTHAAAGPAGMETWDTDVFSGIPIPRALQPGPGARVILNIRADFSTDLCVRDRCVPAPRRPVLMRLAQTYRNPFSIVPSILLALMALPLCSQRIVAPGSRART